MSSSIQESDTPDPKRAPELAVIRPRSLTRIALRSPKAVVGMIVLLLVAGVAVLAPLLATYPATEMHAIDRF
ncbi:MAG: hypothetical protein ACRDFW_08210, partial [bacterium]